MSINFKSYIYHIISDTSYKSQTKYIFVALLYTTSMLNAFLQEFIHQLLTFQRCDTYVLIQFPR